MSEAGQPLGRHQKCLGKGEEAPTGVSGRLKEEKLLREIGVHGGD